MNKFDAVIFDWAGTTVDYGCFAPVQAFIDAFKAYGIEPTVEEVRRPMGVGKLEHVRILMSMDRIRQCWKKVHGRNWTDEDVQMIYRQSEKIFLNELFHFTDLKPYVTETVAKLRTMGIKIGSTTGYTDTMMSIVAPAAKNNGYAPDCWFSPDAVNGMGRPYPYMIFKNMETLKVSSVSKVMKVGDTIADIKEGKNAGAFTVGVLEGSSMMALSQESYKALSEVEKKNLKERIAAKYHEAGADAVVDDIRGILAYIEMPKKMLKHQIYI